MSLAAAAVSNFTAAAAVGQLSMLCLFFCFCCLRSCWKGPNDCLDWNKHCNITLIGLLLLLLLWLLLLLLLLCCSGFCCCCVAAAFVPTTASVAAAPAFVSAAAACVAAFVAAAEDIERGLLLLLFWGVCAAEHSAPYTKHRIHGGMRIA